MEKVKISVVGHVQGVGFRYSTKQLADSLGVKGTVRNESDGSVYIEAIGSTEVIEQFTNALKNNPSSFGQVDDVRITEDPTLQNFLSFKITN